MRWYESVGVHSIMLHTLNALPVCSAVIHKLSNVAQAV